MNSTPGYQQNFKDYNNSLKRHGFTPLINVATVIWIIYAGWVIYNMVTPRPNGMGGTDAPTGFQYFLATMLVITSIAGIYFYPFVCRLVSGLPILGWIFFSPALSEMYAAGDRAYNRTAKKASGVVNYDGSVNNLSIDDSDAQANRDYAILLRVFVNVIRFVLRMAIFMELGFVLGPLFMLFASDSNVTF